MCGILTVHGTAEVDNLAAQLVKLRHRGPDESGLVVLGAHHLGHQRLSIVGLEDGRQPIANENGDLSIVGNGEIYNYLTLRRQLDHHRFATHSDTEVALHLYEELGPAFLQRLDGMFALVIAGDRGFLAARDTLGIKPLYWGETPAGGLVFGSEIKALMPLVREVREFPPGYYYTPETGLRQFRPMPAPPVLGVEACNLEAAMAGIRRRLEAAVQKRLMADVEVGVFLSGGLDSSLIAALAARLNPNRIKTFSAGLEGSKDIQVAREVARYLGTEHHEAIYTPEELVAAVPEVIRYLESFDPSLVRSAVPNYLVAQLAARHVKVVLSGEGADEVFGGYHYYKELPPEKLHAELVRSVGALHNINLQRLDRMTMAHSLEGRVPFLDLEVVEYGLSLPQEWKLKDGVEKWILRQAFIGYLPDAVLWRRKEQFGEGSGAADILREHGAGVISPAEFAREREAVDPPLRSPEELYYYRIFREFYPDPGAAACVGRWARV